MFFKVRPLVTALALVLAQAAGATAVVHPVLTAPELAAAQLLQDARAAQALAFLNGQALGLGLGVGDTFVQQSATTNAQGQAVIRFNQLHLGFRVFGASTTVRVNPEGTLELLAQDLVPALNLPSALALSTDDAIQAAHRNIAPQGDYAGAPTVERIVFPNNFAQGFKVVADPATGAPRLDRDASLVGPKPTQPYVWGYQVNANFSGGPDGFRRLHLIVDGNTGQVLRKWDDGAGLIARPSAPIRPLDYAAKVRLQRSAPTFAARPAKPAARAALAGSAASAAAPVPTKGWGNDQYVGMTPLDTIQSPLGNGYDLVDMTRTTQPHAIFGTVGNRTWFWDASGYTGIVPPLGDLIYPYINFEYYNTYSMDDIGWSADGLTGAGSPDNVWGDGQNYVSPYLFLNMSPTHQPKTETEWHYGDANGQTAAVGAHRGMQMTYDMYKNVLGRLGLDGNNTSMISVVHDNLDSIDNAHFDYEDLMMHYGDGDWSPTNGGQFKSFTTITISGHEQSHGEMHFSAAVSYWGEGMGLNEGNSDIMGMCVEAYSKRVEGRDPANQIPEGVADWVIAREISPTLTPLRYMYKPSLDKLSPDAWYAGIDNLDGHYSMGVPNRFFYFLAMGASTDGTTDTYSPYLPQGMTGIGIDHAAHIWYKAVVEYMTPSTLISTIRGPLLSSATDLYGAGSAEYAAVENALAAVNLGADHAGNLRPLLTIPQTLVDPNSPLGAIGLATESYNQSTNGLQMIYYSVPIIPMGERAKLHVNVANATDPGIHWSAGWPFLAVPYPNDGVDGSNEAVGPAGSNGSFDADGTYLAPLVAPKFAMVQATSVQDPLEYAFLPTLIAHLDTDGDGEQDAVDMGAFALCYSLPSEVTSYVNPTGETVGILYFDPYGTDWIGYSYDDYSLQAFTEAFMNAFAQ